MRGSLRAGRGEYWLTRFRPDFEESVMLRSVKEINGYTIQATDGQIGSVDNFLFDDQSWIIRYAVVNTGIWLFGRKVLITPSVFQPPRWQDRVFPVSLDKEKIRNSPDINTDKPISWQEELKLHSSYGWLPYWQNAAPGSIPAPMLATTAVEDVVEEKTDSHLRSAKEVFGYRIQAKNGEIGHLEDFIIDDQLWLIRYAVVDTQNWLPGKKVLLSKDWIESINWATQNVFMDLTQESIKNSPEFNPAVGVNEEYEKRLYDYYGRPAYWKAS